MSKEDISLILGDITGMASKGESEMLEFKASTGMRNEATKTVCAMLNRRGGYVLFVLHPILVH